MNRIRNLIGALMLAAAAVGMTVPAAMADGVWNTIRIGGYSVEREHRGDWRDRHHRQTDHPAHVFFDGRLWCAGQDSRGRWVSDARCEDAYGRKLVDNPRFVQSVLRNERNHDGWRADRHGTRNDERFSWWNR